MRAEDPLVAFMASVATVQEVEPGLTAIVLVSGDVAFFRRGRFTVVLKDDLSIQGVVKVANLLRGTRRDGDPEAG